jgi:hypothetical protein
MRALIVALAIVIAPGVASAQGGAGGGAGLAGPELRVRLQPHTVPSGAPRQAEDAVRRYFGDPDGAKFREVRASKVASVRRSAFEDRVDGPVSVVCGEFAVSDRPRASWFFVAIKRGQVLWTAADKPAAPGEAYYSCKGAGLTNDGPPQTLPDD